MAFYDSIKLEKGMYNSGRSLTEILEELDPSENYKGTSLDGLDAFQRQLKRYDIKVGGAHSDSVQKFFETSNSAALFPEYVSRAVAIGMENSDHLSDIVAARTVIDGMDYRSVVSSPTDDEKSLKPVLEGASLPETYVRTNENLVKLIKRGRMLVASYEAIKYQRLDLFTVTIKFTDGSSLEWSYSDNGAYVGSTYYVMRAAQDTDNWVVGEIAYCDLWFCDEVGSMRIAIPYLLFTDVRDPSNPYYNAIYWAASNGITKGYSDNTFGIDRTCTRGEAVMFLWRLIGKPEPKAQSKSPFTDVGKTHAFYKAILWASQKGITKGFSDGMFLKHMCFIKLFYGDPRKGSPKALPTAHSESTKTVHEVR